MPKPMGQLHSYVTKHSRRSDNRGRRSVCSDAVDGHRARPVLECKARVLVRPIWRFACRGYRQAWQAQLPRRQIAE
jgi:hypothetical protein